MGTLIIFGIIMAYVLIRTVAYGIYCIKETGLLSGISVFAVAAAAAAAVAVILFGTRGIG